MCSIQWHRQGDIFWGGFQTFISLPIFAFENEKYLTISFKNMVFLHFSTPFFSIPPFFIPSTHCRPLKKYMQPFAALGPWQLYYSRPFGWKSDTFSAPLHKVDFSVVSRDISGFSRWRDMPEPSSRQSIKDKSPGASRAKTQLAMQYSK